MAWPLSSAPTTALAGLGGGSSLTDPSQVPIGMPPLAGSPAIINSAPTFSDPQLIEMFKRWKKESFDQRWVFERQWMRNIWYILNRQWIYFDSRRGQWQDKRFARWQPRPVTNVCRDVVNVIRANFASIEYGISGRPLGDSPKNVITADTIDDLAPILLDDYGMPAVLNDSDFWMLATGNCWLHTCVDYSLANEIKGDEHETCTKCGGDFKSSQIAEARQKCPACGNMEFLPTIDQQGDPVVDPIPMPRGKVITLSPFEIAFPLIYERFEQVPYVIRMRWRDKVEYEQNPELMAYAAQLNFSKTPAERSMQIFKTLPFQNDIGVAPSFFGSGANTDNEGLVEYDVWVKPCKDFPEGQVIRFAGDANPVVIHSEKESLPGPLPYHDIKGNPRFTFHHARYDSIGGRILGSAIIDPIIQKQDQLNRLDAHAEMTINRMANPVWLEPKGAEVEKFTGEPGLVVKWNPLVAGGTAKPERIPGENVSSSVFDYRSIIKLEIQEMTGTYEILKGGRPPNIDSYAGLELLKQTGQARHASAYKERATMVRNTFADMLEIEREFGQPSRVRAVMTPTRAWAFKTFMKADLDGDCEIILEDTTPKTTLTERSEIEHLRQLGLPNPPDPDQTMAIFEKFGQRRLLPGLDAQVQEAWMLMEKFEKFLADPVAISQAQQEAQQSAVIAAQHGVPPPPTGPLIYKRWYNPQIMRQELIKWCLSDQGRACFQRSPAAEQYVDQYLATIDIALSQLQMGILDSNGIPLPTAPGGPAMGASASGGGGGAKPGGGSPPPPGGAGKPSGGPLANSAQNSAGAGPNSSSPQSPNGQGQPAQQQASLERAFDTIQQHQGR